MSAGRPDYPCPATGLPYCPDYCLEACLRLGDGVEPYDEASWPDTEPDLQDLGETVTWPMDVA